MEGSFRYRAFVSYSHSDEAIVGWLHRSLERYRLPRKLVGGIGSVGPVPARLAPIFRDRDELSASGDLSGELIAALKASMFLIVVCSRAAARSRWVNEEVLNFKRLHGEARVLALIVDGEPAISATVGRESEECFPSAIRYRVDASGALSDVPADPIAADMRPQADGRRIALLKLIAGLAGVALDDLVRRETQRRVRRLTIVAVASLAGLVFATALALYANQRRVESNVQRRIAERESAAARATADYLVSTFALANPATENPRTITALTILRRSADRARTELAAQPDIQVRLLNTVGRAYNNLGLFREARAALEPSLPIIHRVGTDGAPALETLANTYLLEGDAARAETLVGAAERQLGNDLSASAEIRGYCAELRAQIDVAQTRVERALSEYDLALKFYGAAVDRNPDDIARVLNNRGLTLTDMGRYEEAGQSLRKANDILRATLGENHVKVGLSFYGLAYNAVTAGHLADAEADVGKSLQVLNRVIDSDNPMFGDVLSLEGHIYQAEKRALEARDALLQAVAAYQRAYHAPNFRTGIAQVYLALAESELGHTAQALAYLDQAKINYDISYGQIHANHGDLLVNRAVILKRAHRLPEAQANCRAGLEVLRQTSGPASSFYQDNVAICKGI